MMHFKEVRGGGRKINVGTVVDKRSDVKISFLFVMSK
jgi:hypothetical protein